MGVRRIAHGSAAWRATVRLRDAVLRRPLGLVFDPAHLAAESDSIHLAAYEGGRLAGCLVLTPLDAHRIRMRQVAVRPDRQGRGIGSRLVRRSEAVAAALGFRSMVLHARASAVPFYLALGYRVTGPEFVEVSLPHRPMAKALGVAPKRSRNKKGKMST